MAAQVGLRRATALCLLATLSACGIWTDYDALRGLAPRDGQGTAFTQALGKEYQALALYEADKMYDWPDASHFAAKSVSSFDGVVEMPEQPDYWDIPETALPLLTSYRALLQTELESGGRNRFPRLAAKAQARYDCWLEELEEGWQTQQIIACQVEFLRALQELTAARRKADAPPIAMSKPKPKAFVTKVATAPKPRVLQKIPPKPSAFEVQFGFDDTMYRAGSEDVIKQATETLRHLSPTKITIAGHADRSGPRSYNLALSRKRAELVRAKLVSFGIHDRLIAIKAYGESQPKIPTKDGVKEPANRRVEILLD